MKCLMLGDNIYVFSIPLGSVMTSNRCQIHSMGCQHYALPFLLILNGTEQSYHFHWCLLEAPKPCRGPSASITAPTASLVISLIAYWIPPLFSWLEDRWGLSLTFTEPWNVSDPFWRHSCPFPSGWKGVGSTRACGQC